MTTVTYWKEKQLTTIEVSEVQHKAWRKYKRTLAIKEPCKELKIIAFAAYQSPYCPAHPSLSRLLNCIASARCSGLISALPARSAMVRLTLRMRS